MNMALKIRLARFGKKGSPIYRIVVMKERTKREGKFIDIVGHYNPITNPPVIKYSKEKIIKWLKGGAQLSEGVKKLIGKIILKKDLN